MTDCTREEAREISGHPGRYEGLTAFEVWMWENFGDDPYTMCDESDGDSEGPEGYFSRVGRWILMGDSVGFKYVWRFKSEADAKTEFAGMSFRHGLWLDQDENDA